MVALVNARPSASLVDSRMAWSVAGVHTCVKYDRLKNAWGSVDSEIWRLDSDRRLRFSIAMYLLRLAATCVVASCLVPGCAPPQGEAKPERPLPPKLEDGVVRIPESSRQF